RSGGSNPYRRFADFDGWFAQERAFLFSLRIADGRRIGHAGLAHASCPRLLERDFWGPVCAVANHVDRRWRNVALQPVVRHGQIRDSPALDATTRFRRRLRPSDFGGLLLWSGTRRQRGFRNTCGHHRVSASWPRLQRVPRRADIIDRQYHSRGFWGAGLADRS